MPRPKLTTEDLKERDKLAQEVKEFLSTFRFTEIKLAQTLGISRRSVQMIKAGRVNPNPATVKKLETLRERYKRSAR